MDAQLIGRRNRLPIRAAVAATVVAIVIGITVTQTIRLSSDSDEASVVWTDAGHVATTTGVDNLGTTGDRHIGSRSGPFGVRGSTDWARNVRGLVTEVREGNDNTKFGSRKHH
jgi:hypothetical protein